MVFSLASFFSPLAPVHAQSAEEILQAVRRAESNASYSATQFVQRGTSREVAKIFRNGVKRRIEWLQPSVKNGDVLVDDGQTVSLYHRAEKTVTRAPSSRPALPFTAQGWKVGAPTRQDGRLVRILNRGNGREITVDEETKVIVRTVNGRSVTALQNIDFGPVPASKFTFAPPAGAKVTQSDGRIFADLNAAQRAAAWLKAPSQLPTNYTFESAIVGEDEVWLRYANNQKRFSIFQQKTSEADLAPRKVDGSWFWKRNGIRFLATDVPEDMVQALSSSMK
jgi:outer membrane lipoprotein-sorting protein